MYYQYEWLSDLAIIPAFELFIAGFIIGLIFWGAVCHFTEKPQKKKRRRDRKDR